MATKKLQAHEGLSMLFQGKGVPNTIIMDRNAAEAAICEVKNGVGWQMVPSSAPKHLWDDCLVREAYI